ncbi:hypothetical protein [Allorhizocola rhizosphaerae]|uniref:hypothetical protein n=1 Tax=Allorhizocola rhizosphaerae TaxID=1872709 RepID=UPI000E3B79A1|nr:hypothetical protein [Allorhizocola rhizosphaerae]
MPLDDRIAMTLYDRMFEVITGADPGAGLPSAFDSQHNMFVMAQRGMVLNAADYRNPWTPGNTDGSMAAAFNIATLTDEIVAPNHLYSPTGQKVSDVYSKMVNLVVVSEPPPSEELQKKRDELKKVLFERAVNEEGKTVEKTSTLADDEQKAFNAYQDAYLAYVATWASAQADENLRRVWPITGAQALQRPKRAFADWGAAGRDQIASTKAQLATLNEGQVARAFADAQFRLNAYKLVHELNEEFYRTNISPSDWASGDPATWPQYSFSEANFKHEFSTEATSWGGGAQVSVGLWSFGGNVSHADSRQAMSQETTDVRLSFRWRICPIYRKWIDASLFKLPNWSVGTLTTAKGISGAPDALMPMIPSALVIVRDVNVSAKWSAQDAERISEATSGGANVGWGPFSVSGNYSHSSTSDKFSAKRTDQGFVIPDIQLLGVVCTKVPPCPPN